MSRLTSDSAANEQSVGAFDAKTHLSRLLQRVEKGEQITITLVEAFLAGTHKARLGPGLTLKVLIAEGRRR
jgi:hypothetical protein